MKTRKLLISILFLIVACTGLKAQSKAVPVVETNSFCDNWFVGASIGTLIYFGDGDSKGDLSGRFAPALNISVGKWITPNVAFRFEYSGLKAKGYTTDASNSTVVGSAGNGLYETKWNLSHYHADLMLNLMNLFGGYKADRLYSLNPYAGFGVIHNATTDVDEFAFNAGLLNTFAISEKFALNLDIKGLVVKDGYDNEIGGKTKEGYLSVSIGATYNFGKEIGWKEYTKPEAPKAHLTAAQKAELENRLAVAEKKRKDLAKELADANQKLATKPKVVKEAVVSSNVVFFEIGQSKLSEQSKVTLQCAADAINADTSDKVFTVTGYADNVTGSTATNARISEARAQAVYDALVNDFNVDKSKLKIDSKGGVDNMYYNNPSLSRVVITE